MTGDLIPELTDFISKKILKKKENTLTPESVLISSGLVDSFSLVDLALFVEDTWGVGIDDTELNASCFDTTQQLADLIQSRVKK